LKWDGHKYKKPPHSPKTGEAIGIIEKWAGHFTSFGEAVAGAIRHRLDGVSITVMDGDGRVVLDFDNARDPQTGVIDPAVEAWLKWLPSYTEVSPSGRGVHVIGKGEISRALIATPLAEGSKATVEMYSNERHLTYTGWRIGDQMQITDCQVGIDKILAALPGEAPASDQKTEKHRPLSKRTALKIHGDNLAALRCASQGQGNALLNTAAFWAGKCFAAGAFEQSAEDIQAELLHIVTREWKMPHDEHGARSTIQSGWESGAADPLELRQEDVIATNPGHVTEMVEASEHVLHEMGLKYFERNAELVNTAYGREVPSVKEIERAADSVVILEASCQTIMRDLDSRATYVVLSQGKYGVEEKPCHVPKILLGHLHDRVHSEPRSVPFPSLDMVTGSPVLLPSGNIPQKTFDERVLFIPQNRYKFSTVPERLTRDDGRAALRQFDEIFGKFPFVDPGEKKDWNKTAPYAVVLAGVMSLVARPYLGLSATPLMAVTAPTRRSGKTKIIEAISSAALGHKPTAVHFVDEEELGKHLQPLMRAGDRAILIDNVERTLQSAKLCILITGGVLRDRVLGESRDVVLRNYTALFATGNNIVIGGDLAARAVRCDIDTGEERPEARHFAFDPVARAVDRHPQLVIAALSALRAYVLAGCPWTLKREPWGGFERWDKLVSGCLTWLYYGDPYDARERIMDADPIRGANLDILDEWFKRYKEREVSLAEIRQDEGEVYDFLCKDNRWDGHHARWILRRLEGQVCGSYRLIRLRGRGRFRVVKSQEPAAQGF
jgi:hypothetical protein